MNCTQAELDRFNFLHETFFEDLPVFKLKVTKFADNTVDLFMIRCNLKPLVEPFYGTMTTYQPKLTEEQQLAKRQENIERAARRAKKQVGVLVRQIQADHMLTLHTRECITDTKLFDSIFQEFVRLVRHKDLINGVLKTRPQTRDWSYVAVREKQDRGALHFHIACVGKQDIPLLRACWYVALGGSPLDTGSQVLGQVDVTHSQRRFSGLTEIHKTNKLIAYLTKYIAKSFEDDSELGKKRYRGSRDIKKPEVEKHYLPIYWQTGIDNFKEAIVHVLSIADLYGTRAVSCYNKQFDMYRLTVEVD